jgi:ribosome maturation factor RimP
MREELLRLLEPAVELLGYELVDVEFAPAGGRGVLRVYIDAANGISLDDCERVSRQLSPVLDDADPIPGAYQLEVSSPGFDRILRKREHFERFVGSRVKVQTSVPLEGGRRRFTGRLLEADAEAIALEVDGARIRLALDQIQKARLAPE